MTVKTPVELYRDEEKDTFITEYFVLTKDAGMTFLMTARAWKATGPGLEDVGTVELYRFDGTKKTIQTGLKFPLKNEAEIQKFMGILVQNLDAEPVHNPVDNL